MQAAVLQGPGTVSVEQVPVPQPGPGEVRVRIEGCGVCASNIEPWEGQPWSSWPGAPGGLGHEAWGVVDAIGQGADLEVGTRVAMLSERAFAGYDVAPVEKVVPLPPALDGQPFPGEPIACAVNIFRRAQIEAGQWVAIIGIGFLGAILTRLASEAGAKVIAISRREESLELARHYGAEVTIPMIDHYKIIGEVGQRTGGSFCPRVIEAVGKQWPLDLAGELIGFGGRLVIAGYHQDGPRQVNVQNWNWKGIDVINAHERDLAVQMRGLREAVELVASGRLDPTPLYTGQYPLDRLGEALTATRDKPGRFVKALVTMA
ncbi:alcohol dehydrogenase [Sphingomonas mucosissima]|uniref:Alcohol dehydrogenase n=2 Tax=Sphingomonas mucosissima TaxID=370959 RepID=A0A245ZMH2_9SPHN|nr:zinc-binding dehydrogenase [Sphingomonas mucosissima]OWK30934.1 alcohol dehydrogenase [Sphingomonas mucosissima]